MKRLLNFRVPNAPRWSIVFLCAALYHGFFSPAEVVTYGLVIVCCILAFVFNLTEQEGRRDPKHTLYTELFVLELNPQDRAFRKLLIIKIVAATTLLCVFAWAKSYELPPLP